MVLVVEARGLTVRQYYGVTPPALHFVRSGRFGNMFPVVPHCGTAQLFLLLHDLADSLAIRAHVTAECVSCRSSWCTAAHGPAAVTGYLSTEGGQALLSPELLSARQSAARTPPIELLPTHFVLVFGQRPLSRDCSVGDLSECSGLG